MSKDEKETFNLFSTLLNEFQRTFQLEMKKLHDHFDIMESSIQTSQQQPSQRFILYVRWRSNPTFEEAPRGSPSQWRSNPTFEEDPKEEFAEQLKMQHKREAECQQIKDKEI